MYIRGIALWDFSIKGVGRNAPLAFTFLFPATWYVYVMSRAPTILDDEVNLKIEARKIEV